MRKIIGIVSLAVVILLPISANSALVGTGSLKMKSYRPHQRMTFPNTSGHFRTDYEANYSINGFSSSGFVDVYCVESAPGSRSTKPYDFWTIDTSLDTRIDPKKYIEATWLANWGLTQAGNQKFYKAVAQVAIWEVIIESTHDPYSTKSLSTGNVQANKYNADSRIKKAAQILLNGAFADARKDQTWDDYADNWLLAVNPTGTTDPIDPFSKFQNYLVPNPVPIPSSVWIFGTGLIGLVGIRRKIQKTG